MKNLKKIILGVSALAVAATLSISAIAEEWRGWNIHKPGYPNTVAMDKFAELLKEKTGGEITLKMFHSGVLGNQPDAIEQVRVGGLAIGNFNLGPIGPMAAEANVVSLPFIFKDMGHMHRALDGAAGDKISAGTVSGDNVTFGNAHTYNTDNNDQMPDGVHDPDTGKNIFTYRGSSAHGYCRTATLSGTNFTFGSEYRFSTDSVNYPRIDYDSAGSKKFLISYTPYHSGQQWGETIIATVTGDVITYDTKYQFSDDNSSASTYASLTYSPDSQSFVAVYRGADVSPAGAEYFVENIRTSNVTPGNYVGIANASYTNGQTASASLPGAVNTAVSGLTVGQKYYVLADGTLNTVADVANIVAGNSVAANKLIVR